MGLAVSSEDDRKEEKVGVIQGVLIHINAIFTIQNPFSRINSSDRSSLTYLIIVSYACYGVGVLFQAGVLFSRENTTGTALSKVYSEKKMHILIFV